MRYTVPAVTDHFGATESFEELAMPYFAKLYNFACWLTQDRAAAEDLVQETYLKALKGFSAYTQGTNFRAWFYRILRHTFLTTQAGIRASSTVSFQNEGADPLESRMEPGTHETPETVLLARIEQETIQNALADLSLNFREIILLCDVEEMTYKEIGQTLGIPVGTVMSRLSRARLALRELLTAPRVPPHSTDAAPEDDIPMPAETITDQAESSPAATATSKWVDEADQGEGALE